MMISLPDGASIAERWAAMTPDARAAEIDRIDARLIGGLIHDWRFWARTAQLPPQGDWRVWLLMAGRGFGKTRAGAEWVRAQAERCGTARIALVAASIIEARQVMVEGPSGLMNIGPPATRPKFEPSLRRLTWATGAQATLYSAAEADMLRGPQHHFAWADEIAKWPNAIETWDNLAMGMRLGTHPRIVATTTPRPVPLVRRLIAEPGVARTGGRTQDNRGHIPPAFLAQMAGYAGTRLGRQELDGELIEDAAGTLWPRALIEACRVKAAPDLVRIVVGVDPPAGSTGDACGIVTAGIDADGRVYALADDSVEGASPDRWARAVAAAADRWQADRVVAEANNGGEMVEAVLRAAAITMPVRLVHASRDRKSVV
jgi:phage terminase large subunit-like protein